MNGMTLLSQAFQAPPIPTAGVALIVLGSWLYLVYKAIYKKEEAFIRLLTGINVIAGVMIFVGISFFAIDIVAGIPTVGPWIVLILDILTYFLAGYLLSALTYFIYQVYAGERKIPGI